MQSIGRANMTEETVATPTALIVDQFGAYVGKHSERLRVTLQKQMVAEAPRTRSTPR